MNFLRLLILSVSLSVLMASDMNSQEVLEPPGPTVFREEVIAIYKDTVIASHEEARNVVSIFGSAKIEGRVNNDLVVVLGSTEINGTVEGDVVVVMGSTRLGPKARIQGDAFFMGSLEQDPSAVIEGQRTDIAFGKLAQIPLFMWLKDWVSYGLLYARPLPHQSPWAWVLAGILIAFYLILALLFPRTLMICVEALRSNPVGSFFIGVFSFLLFGPILGLLIVSVAGLLIIPFLICLLIVILLIGKASVFENTGAQIGRKIGLGDSPNPIAALLIGAILFNLLYMVPILGMLVWGIITPLGLGAVILATIHAFRREAQRDEPEPVLAPAVPMPGYAPSHLETFSNASEGGVLTASPPVAPPLAPGLDLSYPRAGFFIRLWATLLDVLVVGGILLMLPRLHSIALIIWSAYHIGLWAWKGSTIGGIILGIKCVRLDGQPVNLPVAIIRSLASFLSAIVAFVGFFWVGWDHERQSWHDKIAGTTMVKLPKGVPLI